MAELSDLSVWIAFIFFLGYLLITLEHFTRIDKAAIALMTAIICWIFQFKSQNLICEHNLHCLGEHMGNISQIIFFILAALAIVELINAHKGFDFITEKIHTCSKRKLLWIIGFITFFLSAVLDNLTTTIVMVSLLQKILLDRKERLLFGGGVVIAANAGGAWTPIGDVTTTMLWIGGKITGGGVVTALFLPSIISVIASFVCLHFYFKGDYTHLKDGSKQVAKEPYSRLIFFLGVFLLIFVPIFKVLTGLPPFMGMLFALSVLWITTDLLHQGKEEREHLRIARAFSRLEYSGVFFFLGILLAVEALHSAGILTLLAQKLDVTIGNPTLIATAIGFISAFVDNVPLVAASMGMYKIEQFPQDSDFWNLIAYCAGTGGSILIIGSAAGVVYMSLEKVNFFWYLRTISIPAIVGYLAGIAAYLLI